MVDESGLISVEHAVQAKGEELVEVTRLHKGFPCLILQRVVHIKEVAEARVVIIAAPHVALLLGNDFATVLHDESSLGNLLHGKQAPHDGRALLHASNLHLELFFVGGSHQVVQTHVLVAPTQGVALAETEHAVDAVCGSRLRRNHAAGFGTNFFLVGRVKQLSVVLVARTLLGVLAAVSTVAKRHAFGSLCVLDDVLVDGAVFRDVLIWSTNNTNLPPSFCLYSQSCRDSRRRLC